MLLENVYKYFIYYERVILFWLIEITIKLDEMIEKVIVLPFDYLIGQRRLSIAWMRIYDFTRLLGLGCDVGIGNHNVIIKCFLMTNRRVGEGSVD